MIDVDNNIRCGYACSLDAPHWDCTEGEHVCELHNSPYETVETPPSAEVLCEVCPSQDIAPGDRPTFYCPYWCARCDLRPCDYRRAEKHWPHLCNRCPPRENTSSDTLIGCPRPSAVAPEVSQLPVTIDEQAGKCACPGCVRPSGHLGPCTDPQGIAVRIDDELITVEDFEEQGQNPTNVSTDEPSFKLHIDADSDEEHTQFLEDWDALICEKIRDTEVIKEKLDGLEGLLLTEGQAQVINDFLRLCAVPASPNHTEVKTIGDTDMITHCMRVHDNDDVSGKKNDRNAMDELGHTGGECGPGRDPNSRHCSVCGAFARVPFPNCNFCGARPSYHHGRCCAARPTRRARQATKSLRRLEEVTKRWVVERGEPLQVRDDTNDNPDMTQDLLQELSQKTEQIGGIPIMVEPRVRIFLKEETTNDKYPRVCGASLNHDDDFCIMGDYDDKDWLAYREKLKDLHDWKIWRVHHSEFAGANWTWFSESEGETSSEEARQTRKRKKDAKRKPKELSTTTMRTSSTVNHETEGAFDDSLDVTLNNKPEELVPQCANCWMPLSLFTDPRVCGRGRCRAWLCGDDECLIEHDMKWHPDDAADSKDGQRVEDPNLKIAGLPSEGDMAAGNTLGEPQIRRPRKHFLTVGYWKLKFDPNFIVADEKKEVIAICELEEFKQAVMLECELRQQEPKT